MKVEELFKLTPKHKEAVQKIAAICGVKQDVVLMIMEYVLYSALVESMDENDPDKPIEIVLPLIGTITLPLAEEIEFKGMKVKQQVKDPKPTAKLLDATQKALLAARAGDTSTIEQYFDKRWISTLIDQATA
jgi:hypothetical protein